MKKYTSYTLTTAFTLLLLGIIGIQVYWLKTTIDLRNKQFENSVYAVLQNVVKKVDEKENAAAIVNWIGKDTTIVKEHISVNGKSKTVQVFSSSHSRDADSILSIVTNDSKKPVMVKIENDHTTKKEQTIVVKQEASITDTLLTNNRVKEKIDNISVLVYKMLHNDSLKKHQVNTKELTQILTEELKQQQINLNFELLIKEKGEIAYSSTSDSIKLLSSPIHINLYPNDLFGRKTFIYLGFQGQMGYIIADMKWSILMAILFTLLIISVFAYTVISFNRQKKLNEIKTDFINNMSHELKTPIASIQLASDMLYKNSGNMNEVQVKEISKTIHDQSIKINEDIKNILQHSLLEANKTETDFKPLNITKLLNNCLNAIKLLADEKNIQISLHSNQTVIIQANEELLARAIINLLDNAIKYSPVGSKVTIYTQIENNSIQIKITDEGIGINKNDLEQIFDKFYRVEKGNIHNTKGYGLGLSLVKKVATLHQGKIWAESEPGKGSTFILELPIKN